MELKQYMNILTNKTDLTGDEKTAINYKNMRIARSVNLGKPRQLIDKSLINQAKNPTIDENDDEDDSDEEENKK